MEMCYDGALVMPSNYAVMDEDEMMYVEGGATYKICEKAKDIKSRLDQVIVASVTGVALTSALGAVVGNVAGAVIGAVVGNSWFGRIYSLASNAHSQVEEIIDKYGKNKYCTMKSTWSLIFCTNIKVSV